MKILFLVHDGLTVPLGISYLVAIAEGFGHTVKAASLDQRGLSEETEEFSPDLIAFGSTTGFHRKYLDLVKPLKTALNAPVIMGGAHPTFFPEVLYENPWLDFAMRGEADLAFPRFLNALESNTPFSDVGNLIYRTESGIRQNPLLPLVENLDAVPFPRRNLIPGANSKAVFCITGRGCPYSCTYCFNHINRKLYAGLGKYCRRRSVNNVIEEIQSIQKDNPELQMIIFQDDIFIMNHHWVIEFCEKYSDLIGLPFHCHLRANLVTREITDVLFRTGCLSVKMAVETANPHLLNNVLGRDIQVEVLRQACESVKESGIKLITQNILGIPTSTLQDDLQTLKFNSQIKPDFAFATLLQPYPKTEIAKFCREKGLIDGSEKIPDSFFDDSVLKIEHITLRKRIRHLFALCIEFKVFRHILPLLINLPIDRFYAFLDKLWKGYCIKQREFPYKLSLKEYAGSVFSYFRSRYY